MGDNHNRVRFAGFEADFRSGELFRAGARVRLQDKPFQLLKLLLRRPLEVVTRREICAALWPDTHVATSLSLNTAIRKLRTALGENSESPQIIETVRRGYRLMVRPVPANDARQDDGRIRLAVAPFRNLGPAEQEYFADGFTEQMIDRLGNGQREISVIAPFSTMQFKRKDKDIGALALELRADYVINGAVRCCDCGVEVSAELIDIGKGTSVWSETYSREPGRIFDIQDDITHQIARALLDVLKPAAKREPGLSTDPETYALFLKAGYFANKWSAAGFQKAIELFQQVTRRDPAFAPAHGALARLYMGMSGQGVLPPSLLYERTRTEANEALRLSPGLPEALTATGWLQCFQDAEWRLSEESFLCSIENNPSATHGYEGYSHLLTALRRHEEAIEASRRACELDPISPFAANTLGCNYYFARQYDQALAQIMRCLEIEPFFPIAHSCLGWIYAALGNLDKAVECSRVAVQYNADSPVMSASLAHVLAVAGRREEARSLVQQVLAAREKVYVPAYWIGMAFLGLGETDEALQWLEKGMEERDGWRVFCAVDPRLAPLAAEATFQKLLQRIGLAR